MGNASSEVEIRAVELPWLKNAHIKYIVITMTYILVF